MRKRLVTTLSALLFVPLICTLVMCTLAAAPATATPGTLTTDPATGAKYAGSWLAEQVNAQGFIPQAADPSQPNLSTTVQAVIAMAAADVGRSQIDAVLTYLANHVDDLVVKNGNDDPGSLSYLIQALVAAGGDPTDFGTTHTNLVTRLQATKQPSGLFGAADPSFDGAFRQGLALMALHAVGLSDASAVTWLEEQQCADGLWTAFRADTTQPCPAVDPATFTGPDTNSTALAILGLQAQGSTAPAASGAAALDKVRNSDGAWGFLARSDQPTDANSTGLVVTSRRATNGSVDARGTAALLALQVGCDGAAADAGGIAFQASSTELVPDALATAQATPALSGKVLPLSSASISSDLATPCPAAAPSTTAPTTTTDTTPTEPTGTGTVERAPLARTGSFALGEVGGALMLLGGGVVLVQLAHDRRARS